MDSKERCLAVFEGEIPDRAPVCDFGNGAMLGYTGHTMGECRGNAELVEGIMREWASATGADLYFGPIETKGIFMDLPGVEVKLPENDQGSLRNSYYTCPEDVDSKPLYDPFDAAESPNFHRYVVDMLAASKRGIGDAMSCAWCEGPLTTASFLGGTEELLMSMFTEPDEARRVIAKGAELCRDVISAELESIDVDYVVCTDPVSSANMIDETMYREFVLDHTISNIGHWTSSYGVPTMLHICGNTGPMLEDFARTGAAVMSLDHAVDLRAAKEALSGHCAVMGNIDPVSVMLNGTEDDVRREAQRCFDEAGAGGGFVFGAGCAEPNGTPIGNVRAMVEVSESNSYRCRTRGGAPYHPLKGGDSANVFIIPLPILSNMSRKAYSTEERAAIRASMIERAARIFNEKGLRDTSLEEVYIPQGISKTFFYSFFPSKTSLILEVYEKESSEILEEVRDNIARLGRNEGLKASVQDMIAGKWFIATFDDQIYMKGIMTEQEFAGFKSDRIVLMAKILHLAGVPVDSLDPRIFYNMLITVVWAGRSEMLTIPFVYSEVGQETTDILVDRLMDYIIGLRDD